MTKSELKTGMIVVLADGKECMVFKDTCEEKNLFQNCIVATDGTAYWLTLNDYNENLTFNTEYGSGSCNKYDIVEVMKVFHPYSYIRPSHEKEKRTTIWKRKEKKKYTYAQLREILGEEFEVVG